MLQMKKIILTLLLYAAVSSTAFAEKIYMGVFKTSTEYGAWITLRDAPCNKLDGNAIIMSGKNKHNGCWKIEEKQVRIDWLDSSVPNFYDLDGFKLVGDTDLDSNKTSQQTQQQAPVSQSPKTNLYCQAQAWAGDVVLERDTAGMLKKMTVGGEDVSFTEKESSINFSFNSLNITLSSITGMFSYESTTAAKLLFKADRRGSGKCEVVEGKRRF